MYSKTKKNLLLVVPILVLLVTVMSPLMESRLNLLQNSFAQIMPATLPAESGISSEDNQSASTSDVLQQNTSLVNSSNIIQSALLPSQIPITPVSSTSNIPDEDDDDSDDDNDDDKTKSSNDDDNDDDKTKSSNDDDDNDDDDRASNRRSVAISSGGGVSVSIR
jgi:hypothetical protein